MTLLRILNPIRCWLSLLFLFALTGCGGGSGPVTVDPIPGPTNASLRSLSATLASDVAGLGFSRLADVPTSGQATYDGFLSTRGQSGPLSGQTMIGAASVTFTFASTPRFSGSVTSLFDQSARPIGGNLAISNGQIDRDGDPTVDRSMTGNVAGALTLADRSNATFDLIMEGDLLGNQTSFAAGGVFGIAQTTAGQSQIVGQFILEK